jgi:hypothetical protein
MTNTMDRKPENNVDIAKHALVMPSLLESSQEGKPQPSNIKQNPITQSCAYHVIRPRLQCALAMPSRYVYEAVEDDL